MWFLLCLQEIVNFGPFRSQWSGIHNGILPNFDGTDILWQVVCEIYLNQIQIFMVRKEPRYYGSTSCVKL